MTYTAKPSISQEEDAPTENNASVTYMNEQLVESKGSRETHVRVESLEEIQRRLDEDALALEMAHAAERSPDPDYDSMDPDAGDSPPTRPTSFS